jgi:hypothetical protein
MRSNSPRYFLVHTVLPAAAMMLAAACSNSPGDITVLPDCPSGTRAASGITINVDFSKIRPLGQNIQLSVRGTRTATDVCFQPGAQSSFSFPNLEGTTTATQPAPNLADGTWTIDIVSPSGGSRQSLKVTPALNPGATHTLTITGNAGGDLTASFS